MDFVMYMSASQTSYHFIFSDHLFVDLISGAVVVIEYSAHVGARFTAIYFSAENESFEWSRG